MAHLKKTNLDMQTMLPEANPKKAIRLNITTLEF